VYVSKVIIKNYRATEDAEYIIDPEKTIIVGKNNTGKTSCFEFMRLALNNEGSLTFDDYPIYKRNELYKILLQFVRKGIKYKDLIQKISYPEIVFVIDYSDEDEDANLEVLHSAIIDVDDTINEAYVSMKLMLTNEENLLKVLEQTSAKIDAKYKEYEEGKIDKANCEASCLEEIKFVLMDKFKSVFVLKSFSIDPTTNNRKLLDVNISNIINARFIDAQRPIETVGENVFNKVLKHFLKTQNKPLDSTSELGKKIDQHKDELKKIFSENLKQVLDEFYLKEYPSGSKETGVDVNLDIDLEQMFLDSAAIYYKDPGADEKLPQRYNGLGYKNLLLMELEIAAFAYETKEKTPNTPNLLFIEEPEAHMHPQLQERFVEFINEFLNNLAANDSKRKCPIILSTHSSHIANVVDFSKIRYVVRENEKTICKNLADFAGSFVLKEDAKTHIDFLKKYLTLTKCDLFFTDKVILVEGGSERIYIPYCINKLKEDMGDRFSLDHQYYSIIEIGGAYGFIFIPFVRFLNTPTLIITDIDSVDAENKQCLVSNGTDTSNATIKHWMEDELGEKSASFKDILNLPQEKKIVNHVSLAYQTKENEMVGRTLEPAIKIANKIEFNVNKEEDATEERSKIDFALKIVDGLYNANVIPNYIKQGLIWLNGE